MIRETAMRLAFRACITKMVESPKPLTRNQERLGNRIVRIHDQGAGLRKPRAR